MSTVFLFLLLTSCLHAGIAQREFNCDLICFSELFISDRNCDDLAYAIQCYDDHREECESQSYSRGSIGGVRSDFENKGCPPLVVTPTTMEPVTIPLPPCFNMVPPASIENASNLSVAKTFPISSNLDCTYEGEDDDFHHCSMFGFSTLRPFPDQSYRSHLEACNVPQPRFLLEHPTVTVEVEGDVSGETCDHTRLSKVNITFFQSSDCSGTQTKSYVATDSQLLPHTFTDHTVPNNSHSNLQLFVSQDGSAVSLLATWINTTIIVRNYANLLGVTLQVPRHLAEESRGLCRGCPPQALFDMLDLNYQMVLGGCTVENEAVLLNCFSGFSTNFRREFLDVNNATYVDACVYSLWRSNSTSIDALSFLGAVSRDAAALPNVQPIVTTSPPPIISFP